MNYDIARKRMVESQVVGRGVRDRRVIDAMLKVPRHLFVEEAMASQAYNDTPLPIGETDNFATIHGCPDVGIAGTERQGTGS